MIRYVDILQDMLDNVPETVDKREGSLVYDAIAPAAAELAQMYAFLVFEADELFADTASMESLRRRAAERGLAPRPATQAVVKAETPDAVDIPLGARFSLDTLNFTISGVLGGGAYKLQCENLGRIGNRRAGDLVPIVYIEGLKKLEITELLIPAEDEEDVESFRKRYFDSFHSQAFGGNIADYKEKTGALEGVGGVKVYPTKSGAGTVGLTIIGADFGVPSADLIAQVQIAVDPVAETGQGKGFAPIGHKVTVAGVQAVTVAISTSIAYASGWSFTEAKSHIEAAIDGYFRELAESWADSEPIVVRIAQIETRLLALPAVLDISATQLNSAAVNLQLGADEIPKRGELSA